MRCSDLLKISYTAVAKKAQCDLVLGDADLNRIKLRMQDFSVLGLSTRD